MSSAIVRMAVLPQTEGIEPDGKITLVSRYCRSGLAVVRLDPKCAWCVVHCPTGLTIVDAEGRRHAMDLLDALEDLEDWESLAEAPTGLKERVDEIVNNTPRPTITRRTKLQRILGSPEWKGAVVTGPEEHVFIINNYIKDPNTGKLTFVREQKAMAYCVKKGSAIAWIIART